MHKESGPCKSLGFYSKTFYQVVCFEIKMCPEQTKTAIANHCKCKEGWVLSLYSTQTTCPCFHPLEVSFCLSLSRSSFLIQEGFLVFSLISFLLECIAPELREGDYWILTSFFGPSRALSQGIPPSRSLKKPICSPEVQSSELAVHLPQHPWTPPFHGYCSQGCPWALCSQPAPPC